MIWGWVAVVMVEGQLVWYLDDHVGSTTTPYYYYYVVGLLRTFHWIMGRMTKHTVCQLRCSLGSLTSNHFIP